MSSKKPFRKTYRKTYKKPLKKEVHKLAKEVHQLMPPKNHWRGLSIAGFIPDNTGLPGFSIINTVPQGSASANRTGDRIYGRSLKWNLDLAFTGANPPNNNLHAVRMIIFYDRANEFVNTTQLLTSTTYPIGSSIEPGTKPNLQILVDRVFSWPASTNTAGANLPSQFHQGKHSLGNKLTTFLTGGSSVPNLNALKVAFICNMPAVAQVVCNFYAEVFFDNTL